jgi:2-polyprenyl-6-methoxyphenol hydroxylase-like FAD-dependent oxidoreductase
MFNKKSVDIAVLGAGPAGLIAAHTLADKHADFVLLDREKRSNTHSYGLALHPLTLDLLDSLGIIKPVLENARPLRRVAIIDEKLSQRAVINYGELPCKYPYLAVIGQNKLEAILIDTLKAKGCRPKWNHRVRCIEPSLNEVGFTVDRLIDGMTGYAVAHIQTEIDKILDYRANYVIGTDGHDSTARRAAKIDFPEVGPSLDYAVFSFETNVKLPNEMRMMLEGDKTHIYWPMSEGSCRFSFQMEPNLSKNTSFNKDHHLIETESQNIPELSNLHLSELLRKHAPWFIGTSEQVTWRSRVQFKRHLASSFGQNRIWLAGDAAHIVAPAGILSMNVGMLEASDLATCLSEDSSELTRQSNLKEYNLKHLNEWQRLLDTNHTITAQDATATWLLGHKENLIANLPASGETLDEVLKQLHFTPSG